MIGVALAQSGRSLPMQEALIGANGEVLVGQCQAAFPLMVQTVLPVSSGRNSMTDSAFVKMM